MDGDVQPRRTYYYTFLVDRPTAHPATVRLEIPTLAADERRRIEATHEGSVALWSYERDGLTTSDRHGPGGSRTATSAVLGEILGGIATDAVFAVAELFDRERLPDEWIEVE